MLKQYEKTMKKIFITLALFIAGTCFVVAQNNNTQNTQNNQNNQNQNKQPDMQKDTVALFQGHFGGPIKSADILKEDSLTINKIGFQIVGFSLIYKIDTTLSKFDSKNNKLTQEMKTALKILKPGQNFSFINVRVSVKGGTPLRPTFDHIEMFIEKEKQ